MTLGRNEKDPLIRVTYGSYEPNPIYNYSNAINLSASTLTVSKYYDNTLDPNNNNNAKLPNLVLMPMAISSLLVLSLS
jgi:hypothetical protein